jgi:hypothetical protein
MSADPDRLPHDAGSARIFWSAPDGVTGGALISGALEGLPHAWCDRHGLLTTWSDELCAAPILAAATVITAHLREAHPPA